MEYKSEKVVKCMIDRCELETSPGKEFLSDLFQQSSNYPLNRYESLIEAENFATKSIATMLSIPEESICLFSGGFEALKTFMLIHRSEGVAVPERSFFGYRDLSEQTGCSLKVTEWSALLNFDGAKIICLPNNPGGEHLPLNEIPNIGTPFIDATYYFFHQQPEDIREWKSLILGKVINISLSKSFGLAGVRSSFCIGDPEIIRPLNRAKTPYSVSILQSLSNAIMFDEKWYFFRQRSSQSIKRSLQRIIHSLEKIGITYINPKSNYIIIVDQNIPEGVKKVASLKMGVYRITINEFAARQLESLSHFHG